MRSRACSNRCERNATPGTPDVFRFGRRAGHSDATCRDQPLWAPPSFVNLPPPLTESGCSKSGCSPTRRIWMRNPCASSPTRYTEMTADFDGDGKPDRAVLRVGATGWKEGLFVQLSVLPGMWQPLTVLHDQQSRAVHGREAGTPAPTRRPAARAMAGAAGRPREVVLKYPGIDYFQFESATPTSSGTRRPGSCGASGSATEGRSLLASP